MNEKMPGETNNPFKDVEEMEVEITDNAQAPKKEKEGSWEKIYKRDKKIFEEKLHSRKRGVEEDYCGAGSCLLSKKEMDDMCFGCTHHKTGKIIDVGGNTHEGAVEPKDEKGDSAAS